MEFRFENGSDLTVSVNGAVLGGVIGLNRSVRRQSEEILEFLTDKPVAVIPSVSYCIELKLLRPQGGGSPFETAVESVSVSGNGRTEEYTLCTVEKEESRAAARGSVEYTVSIAAHERSISYE